MLVKLLEVIITGTPFHLSIGCSILTSVTRPLPSKNNLAATYLSLPEKNLLKAPSSIHIKLGAILFLLYLQSNFDPVYV